MPSDKQTAPTAQPVLPVRFRTEMRRLVIPFMAHQMLTNGFILLDMVMVGALGETEVASLAAASQFSALVGILMAATFGAGAFITQFHARGETINVHRVLGVMLTIAVCVAGTVAVLVFFARDWLVTFFVTDSGAIAAASGYMSVIGIAYVANAVKDSYANALAAVGRMRLVVAVGVLGLGLNTLLNYGLIFGNFGLPRLELMGAAIATSLSTVTACLLLLTVVYTCRYVVNASPRTMFSYTRRFAGRILAVIYPLLLHEGVYAVGNILYAVAFGHLGVAALAAYQLVRTINNQFLLGVAGFSYAARVMVGRRLSQEDPGEARVYAHKSVKVAAVCGVGLSAAAVVLNPVLVGLFAGLSEEARQLLSTMLYIHGALLLVFFMNHILIVGIFRAGGDNMFSFRLVGLTVWCVGLPLVYLGVFVLHWHPAAVFALFTVEEIVKAVWGFARLRSGKWANNLTRDMH